jgi:GNAT superfamily N-acetyltransferase
MIIRKVNKVDLGAINKVIEKAIMTWQLPERVKRLAMSSYYYNELDLDHMQLFAVEENGEIIAIASLEHAKERVDKDRTGILLHGIYVDPAHQRMGIGEKLFRHVITVTREYGVDGILVKVQKDAEAFYRAQGFKKLDVGDPQRDFENRYWKEL